MVPPKMTVSKMPSLVIATPQNIMARNAVFATEENTANAMVARPETGMPPNAAAAVIVATNTHVSRQHFSQQG